MKTLKSLFIWALALALVVSATAGAVYTTRTSDYVTVGVAGWLTAAVLAIGASVALARMARKVARLEASQTKPGSWLDEPADEAKAEAKAAKLEAEAAIEAAEDAKVDASATAGLLAKSLELERKNFQARMVAENERSQAIAAQTLAVIETKKLEIKVDQLEALVDQLDCTGRLIVLAYRWSQAAYAEPDAPVPEVAGVKMDEPFWRDLLKKAIKERWPDDKFADNEITVLIDQLSRVEDTSRWDMFSRSLKGFEAPKKSRKKVAAGTP